MPVRLTAVPADLNRRCLPAPRRSVGLDRVARRRRFEGAAGSEGCGNLRKKHASSSFLTPEAAPKAAAACRMLPTRQVPIPLTMQKGRPAMTRIVAAMTLLVTSLSFSGAALAAKPVKRPAAHAANGGLVPGFAGNGAQGVGQFGAAGRVHGQQFAPQTMPTTFNGAPRYRPQLRYGPQYGLQYGLQHGPQYGLQYGLQYPMQYGLQVRFPSTVDGEIETENGMMSGRMGNPANAFAPAGAYGFGR
jgi:hypothetical protein